MIKQRTYDWYNGKLKYRVEVEVNTTRFPEPKPDSVTIRIFDDNLVESYPCITATTMPIEVLREALAIAEDML